MKQLERELAGYARAEVLPEISWKIRLLAKVFGKQKISNYISDYLIRESEHRVPFYLPYLYIRENFDYLRRYAQIARHQISMVLIDGMDERTDYFLYTFLEELNYLTIVTERKEYFEGLQERAFQELGLLIDLTQNWENKNLCGNMVWDFTKEMQPSDCYPAGSICFLPHKKEWKIKETLRNTENITVVTLKNVEMKNQCIDISLAETLLVPENFPFRKSRCEELQEWCKTQKWNIRLKAYCKGQTSEIP